MSEPMSLDEIDEAALRGEIKRRESLRARGLCDYWQGRARKEEKSKIALKGQVTRIKNRVGHGVCPCCEREFQNLKRHMNTKHPDFATAPAGEMTDS